MWEIIDDNGTIHSGSQAEMKMLFDIMSDNLSDELSISKIRQLQHQWDCEWNGDLKLIQIHNIHK